MVLWNVSINLDLLKIKMQKEKTFILGAGSTHTDDFGFFRTVANDSSIASKSRDARLVILKK